MGAWHFAGASRHPGDDNSACAGGNAGGVVVCFQFNGVTVATLDIASFTQGLCALAVTADLLDRGIAMVLSNGFFVGVARGRTRHGLPIAQALAELIKDHVGE